MMYMGTNVNDYACEIIHDNKDVIRMYTSIHRDRVEKYSEELINHIRERYEGHLEIS